MKNRYFCTGIVLFQLLLFASSTAFAQSGQSAIDSRTATVDGIKLHYLPAGHGPTVILIHGYTQTSTGRQKVVPNAERHSMLSDAV